MLIDEYHEPIRPRPRPSATMLNGTLNETARRRLGEELQALYEPVIDEPLDPRLAELMAQLETDRKR
ncbi:hypothetical protein [Methylobacterium marchantiae]|uniref:Anti-sigma factor NepR domain-containing protein n=1 Tax=Methylobacterium marchantiae TaxID=600331 RepID=A0ABW3X4P8_9HYPH|nr:hypothetical protein AIGOOFII_0297 [Methylobacterium marchantiae]